MAKNSAGDILTCDWNPIIGCERYSVGCQRCWYLDGIFPWQQRLGNIPAEVQPNQVHVFDQRMNSKYLRTKKGIVGICQHGDLFWDKVPDSEIHRVLDLVEEVAGLFPDRRYILWTKRAKRMADFLQSRYPKSLPFFLACSVSVENQAIADERLPHLARIDGMRMATLEPLVGQVLLKNYLNDIDWVVVGSETGHGIPRPLDIGWVRSLRDETKAVAKPFFIKQLGSSHKAPFRELDGRTWEEFPQGFVK